jgi:hypothetical protein
MNFKTIGGEFTRALTVSLSGGWVSKQGCGNLPDILHHCRLVYLAGISISFLLPIISISPPVFHFSSIILSHHKCAVDTCA